MKLEMIMNDFRDEITTDRTKTLSVYVFETGTDSELVTALRFGLEWSFKIKNAGNGIDLDKANTLSKAFRKIVAETKRINEALKKQKESV